MITKVWYQERTSILNTVLCQHAMAPVRDAAHSLDPARACRWPWVPQGVVLDFLAFPHMEALPEAPAHAVPRFTVRVTYVNGNRWI